MEPIEIEKAEGGFRIRGYPNAVKAIPISGRAAKQLADIALHKTDLRFALECLEGINQLPKEPYFLRQALWRSAVIHFIKCFGQNKSRSSLSFSKVYRAEPGAREPFEYFKNLRNKHFVHDENSYAQCLPGAILNREGAPNKIARVVTLGVLSESICQTNFSNLYKLIHHANEWVISRYDDLCNDIASSLESQPYTELFTREPITYKIPKLEDLHVPRDAL